MNRHMDYNAYTEAMCPVCQRLQCSPDCPEYDGPVDDDILDRHDEDED